MNPNSSLVRSILENLRTPERLDDHPWGDHQFVRAYVLSHPAVSERGAGYQLAAAVADGFRKTIPGTAPRRGKRLDTQWGEFGILAAQYFAPFLFGLPYPVSLRDAWGKIDQAILLFRFGPEQLPNLSDDMIQQYALVGRELEVTPISTISDWHTKGIEHLADSLSDYERHLDQSPLAPPPAALPDRQDQSAEAEASAERQKTRSRARRRWIAGLLVLALTVLAAFAGIKGWRVYQLANVVRTDIARVRSLASPPIKMEKFREAEPILEQLQADIDLLQAEAYPYIRLAGPWLRWFPKYGDDLAVSNELLEMADRVSALLLTTYRAATPLYLASQDDDKPLVPQDVTHLLAEAQPQFAQARGELDAVLGLHAALEAEKTSPMVQAYLAELDDPLNWLDDGLSAAAALPKLLGASSEGPKTYLLLLQNEDELRPTGGFITAVGTFVIEDGKPFGLEIQDSGTMENWSLPYPDAPWQLREYMDSPVLVLRDANWFTDYPTTAKWIEYLYAYSGQHSVDGVIAIDQQALVSMLAVIGPLKVADIAIPITAENVIEYIRAAKTPPVQPQPAGWTTKSSLVQIGKAIFERLTSNPENVDWRKLMEEMLAMLDQRHIMAQVDDLPMTGLLAERGWDGAVRAQSGDFLMVVQSNVGFNKANAAVDTRITLAVDLTQPSAAVNTLTVVQTNKSPGTRSCVQLGGHGEEYRYPIYFCYYNYMRVYVPAGAQLKNSTPHQIPAGWMLMGKSVPAKVDLLDEEIEGIQGYGTLVVVPGNQTLETQFSYQLPPTLFQVDPQTRHTIYALKIQKQSGTDAIPVMIQIRLPQGASVISSNLAYTMDGTDLLLATDLRQDVHLSLVFDLP